MECSCLRATLAPILLIDTKPPCLWRGCRLHDLAFDPVPERAQNMQSSSWV